MTFDRRAFLKTAGAAGAGSLLAPAAAAAATRLALTDDAPAVLVDTTLCVGCRACEAACSEVNRLAEPVAPGEASVFDHRRSTGPEAFTVVNRGSLAGRDSEPRFAKFQCMHCLEPACASVCPVRALEKTTAGPVVYHPERCIGCRYCMVSCPFGVPKYEYAKAVPYVRKCSFCAERQAKGEPPACAEVCPSGALRFGKRGELLEAARERIYQSPDRYVHHIYGEHEAGGTSWLYISDVPFESLALPAGVQERPYPELAATAMSAVPFVMTLWPPLLMALYAFSRDRARGRGDAEQETGHV